MTTLTIVKISVKETETKYGKTHKVGILTKEYGDTWLNGFMEVVEIKEGDVIFAELSQNGKFLNFKYKGLQNAPSIDETLDTPKNTPQGQKSTISPVMGSRQSQENTYNQEKPKDEVNGQAWGNAKTNAVNIVLTNKAELDKKMLEQEIIYWANFIYKLEPKEEVTGDESFNQPMKEEINTDEIPF